MNSSIFLFDRELIQQRDSWLKMLSPLMSSLEPAGRSIRWLGQTLHKQSPHDSGLLSTEISPEIVTFEIDGSGLAALNKLTNGGTFLLYTTLMTALKVCLYRYNGNPCIAVGSPARNQDNGDQQPNLVPIVDFISGQMTFQDLLVHVRATLLEAYSRQRYPFEKLAKDLAAHGGQELFDVVLAMPELHTEVPELRQKDASDTGLLLTISFQKESDRLIGKIAWSTDVFDKTAVTRFAEHYASLIEAGATNPRQRISDFSLLTSAEHQQLLVDWNASATELAPLGCIHEWFERQAEATPNAVAMMQGDRQITYASLNSRANQIAHELRQRSIGPDRLVGVCLERSLEFVVAILSILKAGGAYVPLDPTHPPQRNARILDETCALAVFLRDPSACGGTCDSIVVSENWLEPTSTPTSNLPSLTKESHLAYVIYTSGSTGRPKGVEITHAGLRNLVHWHHRAHATTSADRATLLAETVFDASVWELWPYLTAGAAILIPDDETRRDPGRLVRWMATQKVSCSFLPTPLAEQVLKERWPEAMTLRRILTGGDRLVLRPDADLPFDLINHYGPTEYSVVTTSGKVDAQDGPGPNPHIGRPISHTCVYILDRNGIPVPRGIPGELFVGGAGSARGYLNSPALTSERFVPDAFGTQPGARLYRTGDLVRLNENLNLEFIGRIDQQVKLRGYRIEPGEIETLLREHSDISAAKVILFDQLRGTGMLVAYIVPEEGKSAPETETLRNYLHASLPEYMVPSAFISLQSLPRLPSGKIDRERLPAPELLASGGSAYVAPRNDIEAALAEIWAEVLGHERVGIHDNFFELGGDSILSIQVVARAYGRGIQVTSQKLFQNATVAELAAVSTRTTSLQAEQEPVTGPVPLTPVQCWFFSQEFAEAHHFNQSVLLDFVEPLDLTLLQQAASHLLERHDALRLRFELTDDGWRQWNAGLEAADASDFVGRIDLTGILEPIQQEVAERILAQLQSSLKLSSGPLLRVAVIRRGAGREQLFVTIHHLAVDAVSWRILLQDLLAFYEQLRRGETIHFLPKSTSWKQWAETLSRHASDAALQSELAFWNEILREGNPSLPQENAGGTNDIASLRMVTDSLTVDETHALLTEIPAAFRTQINDILLTALVQTICAWTGRRDLFLQLEGHGREELFHDLDVSRTVGWFTSLFPVVLHLPDRNAPGPALTSIKEQLRRIPNRGIGYGILRYLRKSPELAMSVTPAIGFNYLGQFDQMLPAGGGLKIAAESSGPQCSRLLRRPQLLDVTVAVSSGRLQIVWGYSQNIHQNRTIEELATTFLENLRALIAHCQLPNSGGCSPSDFPLASLDQVTLDRLAGNGRHIEDIYPLSPMQQGMLFHSLYRPNSGAYVGQYSCRLEGNVNPRELRAIWQTLLDRHATLRTYFAWSDQREPLQIVLRKVQLPWTEFDWRDASESEQQRRKVEFLEEDRLNGFALTEAPLVRCAIFRLSDQQWQLIWTFHHLVLDGWSLSLLLKELSFLQSQPETLQPVALPKNRPYRDYIAWLQQQDNDSALIWWKQKLHGFRHPTQLPASKPRTAGVLQRQRHCELISRLEYDLTEQINTVLRRRQLTSNTLIQGVWAVLLSSYSGTQDIVFGSTDSGRRAQMTGSESVVGLCINTLPARVFVRDDVPIVNWLNELQEQQAEQRQYTHVALTAVQKGSELSQGTPLFESVLVFENYPLDVSLQELRLGSERTPLVMRDMQHFLDEDLPLILVVIPGSELTFRLKFQDGRFHSSGIEQILPQLKLLLEQFVRNAETEVGTLKQLLEEDRQRRSAENVDKLRSKQRSELFNIKRRAADDVHRDESS